jgi:hypothetical protein
VLNNLFGLRATNDDQEKAILWFLVKKNLVFFPHFSSSLKLLDNVIVVDEP